MQGATVVVGAEILDGEDLSEGDIVRAHLPGDAHYANIDIVGRCARMDLSTSRCDMLFRGLRYRGFAV